MNHPLNLNRTRRKYLQVGLACASGPLLMTGHAQAQAQARIEQAKGIAEAAVMAGTGDCALIHSQIKSCRIGNKSQRFHCMCGKR